MARVSGKAYAKHPSGGIGASLGGVVVKFRHKSVNHNFQSVTNKSGYYSLNLHNGDYTVTAEKTGFRFDPATLIVQTGSNTANIGMTPTRCS